MYVRKFVRKSEQRNDVMLRSTFLNQSNLIGPPPIKKQISNGFGIGQEEDDDGKGNLIMPHFC